MEDEGYALENSENDDDDNEDAMDVRQEEAEDEVYELADYERSGTPLTDETQAGVNRWKYIEKRLGHSLNDIATVKDMRIINNLNYDDGEEAYYDGAYSPENVGKIMDKVAKDMNFVEGNRFPYSRHHAPQLVDFLMSDELFREAYTNFKLAYHALRHMKIGSKEGIPTQLLPAMITSLAQYHRQMYERGTKLKVPEEKVMQFMQIQDIPMEFNDRHLQQVLKIRVKAKDLIELDRGGVFPMRFYDPDN